MRATFIVPYPLDRAPGQRFRFEQWLSLLPPGKIDAEFRPLLDTSAYDRMYESGRLPYKVAQAAKGLARRMLDLWGVGRTDVVWLYREAFPLGPPVLESLLERRVPVVYDFDDAIWLGDTSEANSLIRRFKRPNKVDAIVARATTTTVANDFLAEYARRHSPHVEVIPTTIDIDRYRPQAREENSVVRLGWSGSPTTSKHLRVIEGALRRILAELPIELVVMGDPAFELRGAGTRLKVLPWRKEHEIEVLSSFDIGLMPLPDDEWSRGKAGFKALLYMSLGIPAIVSPVGVNREIVRDGENGLTASTEDEWVAAVVRLVEDVQLRRSLGQQGRETVVERYSGQRWAPRFLEILESAAETGRR